MKIGDVFVKEFFIVAVAPKALPGSFAICGDGGGETSTSAQDGLFPCIGTDYAMAKDQYNKAVEAYKHLGEQGVVVLIKFTGGVIERMETNSDEMELHA